MSEILPDYVMHAGGAVGYDPVRAKPGSGFGPYEVHPQLLPATVDGSATLVPNGDWLVLFPEGGVEVQGGVTMRDLAFTKARGGRVAAEKLAALQNEGAPTRVVDLAGRESTSSHTADSVRAELARAQGN